VPAVRFHDVRHTYATVALQAARTSVGVLSRRLGHANTAITMNVYAHVMPGEDEAAADATAAAILGPRV
jgi:integrase